MTSARVAGAEDASPFARRLRAAAPRLAGAAIAIGVAVLVGWAIDSTILKCVLPGMISMKVNTAVGLILLAVALVGIGRPSSPAWGGVAVACLLGVSALSLMTLAEYALGVDLRIDNALFLDRDSPRFPGRNAPATNFAFLGIAAAYGLLRRGRAVTFAQAVLFVVTLTPLTALSAYLYRTPGMLQHAPYPAVALNSSVALLLLCLGGLFVRADAGVMAIVTSDTLAGSMARKLLPAAIGLPVLTGLIVLAGERADLFSVAFGSAMTVGCCALFFAGAVCWSAALLWQTEADRAVAEGERAQAEQDVREREQHLRTAIETARLGAWQLHVATGVVEGSTRYKANFGLPPTAPLTRDSLLAAVHPDDRERLRPTIAAAIEGGGDYHAEYRVVWPDGSVHWLVGSGRCVYDDDDGRLLRLVGVTLDVTADKRAAAEREALLDAERHARGEAERANRMKDEFLATVSHELRTPLNAIFGWSQMLRRPNVRPEAFAEGLASIERNARAQTQIIDDLLDMSRIISGKISLDAVRVDLAAAIRASIETVRATAAAKEIAIAFDAPADVPTDAAAPMLGDFNRLQQVFWNLLSNAIKFTPRGGRVTVELTSDAGQWHVDVTDTGEGIGAAFLPFVFDRFRQADASTTRRHGGLGLGLAIVKQLVEIHGGTVRVRSDGPDRGSTFTVSLPANAVDAPTLFPAPSPEPERTMTTGDVAPREPAARVPLAWDPAIAGPIRGARIVIVDDEPDARELLRQLLEHCGASVLVAVDADEAVGFIERERPDALISDIGMPGTDGYALIARVRALGDAGALPAVALTAYARADDRVRALRAGFQMHVPKPVEPAELLTVLGSLIRRR